MNEKQLEQLMTKAAEHGLDDLEVRLEVYLVFGGEKTRVVAFQVEPEMFPPTFAAMAAKMDELGKLRTELQKVLDAKD